MSRAVFARACWMVWPPRIRCNLGVVFRGLLIVLMGVGCSSPPVDDSCVTNDGCPDNAICVDGMCVNRDAGTDAGAADVSPGDVMAAFDASQPPDATLPQDGSADSRVVDARARLQFELLYTGPAPGCFIGSSGTPDPLVEWGYSYKRIEDQVIDGVATTINPRAYVIAPPRFDPATDGRLPVIAMFHGGGWVDGTPVLWIPAARYFAARGMLAIVFQYRLGNLHDATPQQSTADALSAVRWIRTYQNELGADASRILSVGDSAGGHLALATTTIETVVGEEDGAEDVSARPAMNFALYPVSNPSAYGVPLEIDPFENLSADNAVPTFIMHGVDDSLSVTPPSDSIAYCARHNELSITTCTVELVEEQDHNFFPVIYASTLTYIDTFLIRAGWLAGDVEDIWMLAFNADAQCQFSGELFNALQTRYMLAGDGPVW